MVSLTGVFLAFAGMMSNLYVVLKPIALILAILCMIKYLRS